MNSGPLSNRITNEEEEEEEERGGGRGEGKSRRKTRISDCLCSSFSLFSHSGHRSAQ